MEFVQLRRFESARVAGNSRVPRLQRIQSMDGKVTINKGSISALEELVQCGLCFEKLYNPRMLPCQHTFCLYCLQTHMLANVIPATEIMQKTISIPEMRKILKDVKSVSCPTCRKEMHTNNDCLTAVENLPNNLYIHSLLKVLENSKTEDPLHPIATNNCILCDKDCLQAKNNCDHCQQIFCENCWSVHMEHIEAKLPTLIEKLHELEASANNCVSTFKECTSDTVNKIKTTIDAKIKELKNLETGSLKECAEIEKQYENKAKKLQESIANVLTIADDLKNKQMTTTEKITALTKIDKEVKNITHRLSLLSDNRISFDTKEMKLLFNMRYCAIPFQSPSQESEEDENLHFRNVQQSNPLGNAQNLTHHYKIRNFVPRYVWTKCSRPAGVAISPWNTNHLYLAAIDFKMILIMDLTRMKIISRLTHKKMFYPQAIAFGKSREEVYVVDKLAHCVHIFSKNGQYLKAFDKLKSPEGIAAGPNGEVIVSDTGNDRVVVLDPNDGKLISTIGMNCGRTELNMPTGLAVFENKVYIADSGNNRIKIYTVQGQFQLEIGSLGKNKGQLRSAEVVAVDPLGFILVGDGGNARIQIFKPDGSFLRVVGGQGKRPGKFEWVSGIAVADDLKIITTDCRSHQLQVFYSC